VVQAPVALRVDVDTRRGLGEGVPRLLELFRGLDVRASFFVTMGPERSGTALRRAWRTSFVLKMLRTNPIRLYGVRALLAGTLLPARLVGAGVPALLRDIAGAGHEVAPHGWDHFGWQNRVDRMTLTALRRELRAAAAAYETALGTPPASSAAPGWRMTDAALLAQEEFGLAYASDIRGRRAVRPRVDGGALKTVQIPTTMPTMDELLGRVRDIEGALTAALGDGLNVFTLHAEVEGGPLLERFAGWVKQLRRSGRPLVRLSDVAEAARACPVPEATIARDCVAGRSGWVAVAGQV